MLIDTHCHLNDEEHFPDPDSAIRQAREAGVERVILIGVDLPSARRAVEIAERNEGAYAAVGFHPNYTAEYETGDLKDLEPLLAHPKSVGFGEIGLDFYRETSPAEKQRQALRDQLDLADTLGKPVIFHCRHAYEDLLQTLEARPVRSRYLFHCFAGTIDDARRALALGAYFGVDGPVTYNTAKELRETLRALPLERLVLETDSPYLPPVPYRGKPNHPAYLRFINDALANTMGVPPEVCEGTTTLTARSLFGI